MIWKDKINPEGGPYKVLLKRGELIDSARTDRAVPYKIYYPSGYTGAPLPVIIWSHGFGGNRDGASFLSRFICSYGYVLVHITHAGTDSSLWEGKPGHPWDILRKIKIPRSDTLARFDDIPFVLNQLLVLVESNPELEGLMDLDNLGMSGHSFGAMTTQMMAGQLFPDHEDNLQSHHEPRFKAGILYSPVPIRHLTDEEQAQEAYSEIKIPLLHMTGTDDDSPIEGFGYEHRLSVFEHTAHPDKHLLILKDGDHMVYNGTRGKLGKNDLREAHEDIIKHAALAYWDTYLKNDKSARTWLEDGGFSAYMGEQGTYSKES